MRFPELLSGHGTFKSKGEAFIKLPKGPRELERNLNLFLRQLGAFGLKITFKKRKRFLYLMIQKTGIHFILQLKK